MFTKKLMVHLPFLLLVSFFIFDSFSQVVYWQNLGDFNYVWDVKTNSHGDIFICIQSERGILRSTDGGNSWELLDEVQRYIDEIAINSSNEIFIAAQLGLSIYKSTDNGDTWVNTNSGGSNYRALHITNNGNIYAGNRNGLLTYSQDNGISWSILQLTSVQINSIASTSNEQVFVCTEGQGMFTSTDFGLTWSQIINPNISSYINSIDVSETDEIYTTNYDGISISSDFGATWLYHNTFYDTRHDGLAIDSVANIFLGHTDGFLNPEGVYKSTDNGLSWEYMGGPQNPNVVYVNSQKIYLAGSFGLHLYNPEYVPYIGNNYFPLQIGNHWQFASYFEGMGIYDYSISNIVIERDTIINNLDYYFWNQWPRRYSDSTKTIYIYANDSDKIYMDFNLFAGAEFIQCFGSGDWTVRVTESEVTRFGRNFISKGFSHRTFDTGSNMWFAEEIGFFSYGGFGPHSSGGGNLITCILISSQGDTTYISDHHKPSFNINPIYSINNLSFEIDFEVSHELSVYTPPGYPGQGLNFVDSVQMNSYYSNSDSIITLETIYALNDINGINPDYSVDINVDTMLLKDGYSFYYKFTAKDKALIPEVTFSPDTGYYECVWGGPVTVNQSNLIPEYFLNQNYPNPFNPTTTIEYNIANEGIVEIDIMDVLGRKIKTLVSEFQSKGVHKITFDAADYSSGIYFYRLKSGNFIQVKKMLLLK